MTAKRVTYIPRINVDRAIGTFILLIISLILTINHNILRNYFSYILTGVHLLSLLNIILPMVFLSVNLHIADSNLVLSNITMAAICLFLPN